MIHAVHGWGETDKGAGSVETLRPYFGSEIYRVHKHFWPRLKTLALIQQRRRTRQEAAALAPLLKDGDDVITYSNGAAVVRRALLQTDAVIDTWVIIGGALPRDFEVPPNVRRVIVLYSDDDIAVLLGLLWTWINPVSWFLGHDWGALGRYGYTGDDPRVENWRGRQGRRHLGWFDRDSVTYWGPRIARGIRGESIAQTVRGTA